MPRTEEVLLASLGASAPPAQLRIAPRPDPDDELAPPEGTPLLVLPDGLTYWVRSARALEPEHGLVEADGAEWHGPISWSRLDDDEHAVASEAFACLLRRRQSAGLEERGEAPLRATIEWDIAEEDSHSLGEAALAMWRYIRESEGPVIKIACSTGRVHTVDLYEHLHGHAYS